MNNAVFVVLSVIQYVSYLVVFIYQCVFIEMNCDFSAIFLSETLVQQESVFTKTRNPFY